MSSVDKAVKALMLSDAFETLVSKHVDMAIQRRSNMIRDWQDALSGIQKAMDGAETQATENLRMLSALSDALDGLVVRVDRLEQRR